MTNAPDINHKASYPITVHHIAYHAGRVPEAIAIIDHGKAFSYEVFYRDICKMIAAFKEFEIKTNQAVAVEFLPTHDNLASFYFHWITLLALEAYGVATMSYTKEEAWCLEELRDTFDLVMTFDTDATMDKTRHHTMSGDWLRHVMSLQPVSSFSQSTIKPEAHCRIIKSSGTTGQMKYMYRSFENQDFIYRNAQFRGGYTRQSRYFATMGFSVSAVHAAATTCIQAGGACVYDSRESAGDVLSKYAITHASFLLHSLTQVMDSLPDHYLKPPNLRLLTIGSAISIPFRTRVLDKLATSVAETYGANECSTVSTMDADGNGVILPGVDIEIVDDNGALLIGAPGWVRVRSLGSVRGYIGNPEATQKMFKNGWFYPGDIAILREDRTLQLVGRGDDILNIQGLKYAPQELEYHLLDVLPIEEVCVLTCPDDEGIDRAVIVIVPKTDNDQGRISENLPALIPRIFGDTRLVFVSALPRTSSGKVQRGNVREMVSIRS